MNVLFFVAPTLISHHICHVEVNCHSTGLSNWKYRVARQLCSLGSRIGIRSF